MKNDLSCGVARDLMPLYAEGLAGEESREALERHTAQCPACAARLAAMTAPEEPVMEEPEREVDYLKTIRRKTKGRMVLAVVCTLLVLAALWGLRVYVIGAPADREARRPHPPRRGNSGSADSGARGRPGILGLGDDPGRGDGVHHCPAGTALAHPSP